MHIWDTAISASVGKGGWREEFYSRAVEARVGGSSSQRSRNRKRNDVFLYVKYFLCVLNILFSKEVLHGRKRVLILYHTEKKKIFL